MLKMHGVSPPLFLILCPTFNNLKIFAVLCNAFLFTKLIQSYIQENFISHFSQPNIFIWNYKKDCFLCSIFLKRLCFIYLSKYCLFFPTLNLCFVNVLPAHLKLNVKCNIIYIFKCNFFLNSFIFSWRVGITKCFVIKRTKTISYKLF